MKNNNGFRAHTGGHFFVALALGLSASSAHAEWHPYFISEAFARSEPISVMDAVHGWEGDHKTGERQYIWSRLETGVKGEHWGMGVQFRKDYALSFSKDASELFGAIQNDEDLDAGRTYDVNLEANIIETTGLRFTWQDLMLPTLKTEFGLTLLKADYMIDGSLNGTALATGDKSYTYSAWADYSYTEDVLFEREVDSVTGYGFALDAHVDWQFRPDWRLDLQAKDLPGWVWWKDLPYTRATAESAREHTEDDGFHSWDPMVSGIESNHSRYKQTLPFKGTGDIYYSGWDMTVAGGLSYQFSDLLPRIGTGWQKDGWSVMAWYWPKDNGLGVDLRWREWQVGLAMDDLVWDDAHFIAVNLSYRY